VELAVARACGALRARLESEHGGVVPPGGLVATADTQDDVARLPDLARYSLDAQFAEAWVDVDTGEVRVPRLLGVFAAGRIVNAVTAAACADVPDIEVAWIDEDESALGPLGIKGIGELGIVGTAAAIANAVHHATGIRVRDLPIRLDRLVR
jgi:xanthine dehydrogenase YagR molybdenum-binding subunit